MTVNGVTTDYTYNSLDQLISAGSVTYDYDNRGNLSTITNGSQVTSYNYDAADRLISATAPGLTASYGYDADGRRVTQTFNGQVTNSLWDEASPYGDVVLETNGSGSVLASYVLGGTGLISQTRSGSTNYYLQDGQGSTRALTNGAKAVTDTYSYTAFGELFNQTGITVNPYQYTGQQFDSLVGNGTEKRCDILRHRLGVRPAVRFQRGQKLTPNRSLRVLLFVQTRKLCAP